MRRCGDLFQAGVIEPRSGHVPIATDADALMISRVGVLFPLRAINTGHLASCGFNL